MRFISSTSVRAINHLRHAISGEATLHEIQDISLIDSGGIDGTDIVVEDMSREQATQLACMLADYRKR